MSLAEAYIKNLSKFPIWELEKFSGQWINTPHPDRNNILTSLIGEKLNRYEEEY